MKTFFQSCGLILTFTAWAKFYSASGSARILGLPDALFGVPYHTLLLTSGVLECGIVAFLLLSEDNISKCACVCWLALNFTLYRVGTFWVHPGTPCPCLGNISGKLGLKPQTANWLLEIVVVYMLAGGVFFLIKARQHERSKEIQA